AGAARAAERVAAAVARRHERRFIHSAFGRAMSDRLRRLMKREVVPREDPSGVIGSVIEEVALIAIRGSATSDDALEELSEATGLSPMKRDRCNGLVPIIGEHEALVSSELVRVIRGFQLDRLVKRIER